MSNKCTAIVLAAGQGKRMGGKVKKQLLELDGKPLIYYALHCFQKAAFIDEIVLVTSEDCMDICRKDIVEKYHFTKVRRTILGGRERYDSVYAGLLACEDCDYVFIHDGARPFIDEALLIRALEAAQNYGACSVAVKSKNTIKLAGKDGFVQATLERENLWCVQTPQVFRYSLIREAHEELQKQYRMDGITDDLMVLERQGKYKVKLVEGSDANIKITTPEDLLLAKAIIARNQSEHSENF